MNTIDSKEYLSLLKQMSLEGKEVSILVTGSSMNPFLCHKRDTVWFTRPERPLKKGDIVFYQRDNGQFVLHRIQKIHNGMYDIIGDNQTTPEKNVREDQIFGLVKAVRRNGKMIYPDSFWWWFFAHVWLHMILLRMPVQKAYAHIRRHR